MTIRSVLRFNRHIEEGEQCPECGGRAVYKAPENCFCHLAAPCTYCEENMPQCEDCGLTEILLPNAPIDFIAV